MIVVVIFLYVFVSLSKKNPHAAYSHEYQKLIFGSRLHNVESPNFLPKLWPNLLNKLQIYRNESLKMIWDIWPQERLGVEEKEISCTYRKVYKVTYIYTAERSLTYQT
jgi:hypothetical protein